MRSTDLRFQYQIEDFAGPLLIGLSGKPHVNIFCMFSITKPIDGPVVDEKNQNLGDSFVLINNSQLFIDRFCSAAQRRNFRCGFRPVEYYEDSEHSGETGPFRKRSTFSHQSEFRFCIWPGSKKPIELTIGNLEDITTPVLPLNNINSLLNFNTSNAKLAGLIPR